MKRLPALLASALVLLASACGTKETTTNLSFTADKFREPDMTFRSMPFWSLNDSLSADEMFRQLKAFKDGGFGGAFLHSRVGLLTPYLSDEWFRMMDAGVKACQDLGMEAWFYDEDKWPSGFAGGIIPRQSDSYRAHTLVRVPAGTPVNKEDRVIIEDENWLYIDFIDRMGQSWYNGTCWVDLMNPEMVQAFIDCSYVPYVERYAGQKLVKGIFTDEPQIKPRRTDYKNADAVLPYSPVMDEAFRQMWGYSIKEAIPSLLDTVGNWRAARLHYYRTVASCMENAYSKKLGDWCAEHNFLLTGHYNGEQASEANMENEGDLAVQLRHMGVPGVDALGLGYLNFHNDFVMSSVANQYGKQRRINEIFGISGHNLSFEDRMWLTAYHTICGTNLMCPHLSLYSMKGERKRDYPPTISPQQPYWKENKSFEDFSARLCYTASCGSDKGEVCVISPIETDYLVSGPKRIAYQSGTTTQVDQIINSAFRSNLNIDIADEQILSEVGSAEGATLVIGKMKYSTVVVPHLMTIRPSTIEKLVAFSKAGGRIFVVKELPEYVDGAVDEAAIASLGACSTIVSDSGEALQKAFATVPHEYTLSGEGAADLLCRLRESETGRTIQISNPSRTKAVHFTVTPQNMNAKDIAALMDPVSGKCLSMKAASDGSYELKLSPAQTFVLFFGKKTMNNGSWDGEYSCPEESSLVAELPMKMDGRRLSPNALPLDFASFSKDGGASWSDEEPVLAFYFRTKHELWNGDLMIKYSFNVKDIPATCRIAIEQPWLYKSITLNGTALKDWGEMYVDHMIRTADIAPLVKEGRNEIILNLDYISPIVKSADAVERYGTEIETIYVTGDFAVEGKLAKDQPQSTWRNETPGLAPKPMPAKFEKGSFTLVSEGSTLEGNITPAGYPFFAGSMEYHTTLDLATLDSSKEYLLKFPGTESTLIKTVVNGQEQPALFCSPWESNITEALKEGSNDVTIILTGSLRNLMGPYHHVGGELSQVGPSSFTGEPNWPNKIPGETNWYDRRKDGTTRLWRDDYYCIPFGMLEPVQLVSRQK